MHTNSKLHKIACIITFIASLIAGIATGNMMCAGQRKLTPPVITAIENRSPGPVNLQNSTINNNCSPRTKKLFRLRPITIPVIPFNRYREQFVAGDPLFPAEALHITTSRGKFAVWRDETGIMCSLEFVPGRFRDDCIPVNLLRNIQDSDKQQLIKSLMLLLTINELGDLSLEPQE